VPGAPVSLTVPSDRELGAGGASASDTAADAEEPEATATPDASSGTGASDTGAAETGAADTDAAAPPAETATPEPQTAPDTATSDQPPAAGSAPEQFESFCEQNAGAC